MDGNRRWALANGLPLAEGYRRGIGALRQAVRAAIDNGVGTLTVYGFSTENWGRDQSEIGTLMQLCAAFTVTEKAALMRQGVRVRVIGDIEPFLLPARAGLRDLVKATQQNRQLTLNLALNYSGRTEIVRAIRLLAREVEQGRLAPNEIDEAALRARLYAPDMPDPDLLIRTGGEKRLSDYLLWESAYAELYFTDRMWPEFDGADLASAVNEFRHRERRFGAVPVPVTSSKTVRVAS